MEEKPTSKMSMLKNHTLKMLTNTSTLKMSMLIIMRKRQPGTACIRTRTHG
ncbi:hypothetical protein D3C80_1945270 [compost metagenome]